MWRDDDEMSKSFGKSIANQPTHVLYSTESGHSYAGHIDLRAKRSQVSSVKVPPG